MEYNVFIDELKDKFLKELNRLREPSESYRFHNILRYINIKYDLKVSHLARVFNIKRQTMYNYFKLPTYRLPKLVLDRICIVYGQRSIQTVLELEFAVFFIDDVINKLEDQFDEGKDYTKLKHPYKYLLELYEAPSRVRSIRLKTEYDFSNKWKSAITLNKESKVNKSGEELNSLFDKYVANNSLNYSLKTLRLLSIFPGDDIEFYKLLKSYHYDKHVILK